MPDTSTEVAIATTTLSSAASSITFSSIPATYTDLRLVFNPTGVDSTTGARVFLQFNSSALNMSYTFLQGNGTTATSGRGTTAYFSPVLYPSTTRPTLYIADIFSYANTSINKTSLHSYYGDNNGSGVVESLVRLWQNTAAISSITLTADSSGTRTFSIGTTATLYGIL